MFAIGQRDALQAWLLRCAQTDESIVGAAFTGSYATATADRWSDTDLVLAVRGDLTDAVTRWTRRLYDEWNVQHHWDLVATPSLIRVFLLPQWLEIDLTFAPEQHFGSRGPQWQLIFGNARQLEDFPAPDPIALVGHVWHHALHAWVCLQRRRYWQAEHWITGLRDCTITLACLRLGHPSAYAKGAHLLPDELTSTLEATLVRAITEPELYRAFNAAITMVTAELTRCDPELATRLGPMLSHLVEQTPKP
jgi:hypothetical protein